MKVIKSKLAKLATFFKSVAVVLIASIFVMSVVYASTTIGTNITTGGNLTVSGWASTTNATTTGYLYVGQDITEPAGWNWGVGDLIVADDVFINGTATATDALWVGSGTADHLNLAGGDLYVQGNAEFDALTWFSTVTSTSATATSYLWVGGFFTVPPSFDFLNGDVGINNDLTVNNIATVTAALWVGSGTANNLNLAGGDLYVQDDLEVDSVIYLQNNETISNTVNGLIELGGSASTTGDLYVSGGTFDLTTSTATTTGGLFVRDNTTATTTVSIGEITDGATKTRVGCLEIAATTGAYYRCYIDTAAGSSTALVCVAGRCN